jgi:calcineurin-like phosphoesterase family protein
MNVNINLLDDGEKLTLAIALINHVINANNMAHSGTGKLDRQMKYIGEISEDLKDQVYDLFDFTTEFNWRYTSGDVLLRLNGESKKNQSQLNKVASIMKSIFGDYKLVRVKSDDKKHNKSRVYFCPKFKD